MTTFIEGSIKKSVEQLNIDPLNYDDYIVALFSKMHISALGNLQSVIFIGQF